MSVAPGPKASSSATNRRNTTGSSQRPSSRINNELNTPGRITLPPSSISIPKPEIPAVLLESLNSPCTGYTCSYKRMAKILTANNASSVLAAFNDHQVSHILKHLQGIECMAGVDTPIEEIDLETAMGKFGTQAHESPVEDGMFCILRGRQSGC